MLCAACGNEVKGGIGMGGVLLCHYPCAEDVRIEMERLRAEGKRVSVPAIAREMYRRAHPQTGDYLIRDVPQDLWDKAKHRAIDEGTTLRELVLAALAQYLKQQPTTQDHRTRS